MQVVMCTASLHCSLEMLTLFTTMASITNLCRRPASLRAQRILARRAGHVFGSGLNHDSPLATTWCYGPRSV